MIRKNGAGWEEWKNEGDYFQIAKELEWKYIKDDDGQWKCPPGEEFAKNLGLSFKACVSSSINWSLHRNYVLLDDYLRRKKDLLVENKCLDEIKKAIFSQPGITLKKLIDQSIDGGFFVDDIYISIIKNEIYVNLMDAPLAEPESVKVFLHKEHASMYFNLISCEIDFLSPSFYTFEVGSKILWDSQIWTIINLGNDAVSLISDEKYNEIPKWVFDRLVKDGKIVGDKKEKFENDSILDFIIEASEEEYKVANFRLENVRIYLEKGSKVFNSKEMPNLRLVRDWVRKFRKAEKLFGNGYVGLLPKNKNKGNNQPRFCPEVIKLMDQHIIEKYENEIQKNKAIVYGEFKNICEKKGYIAPSLTTFCKYINNRPIEEQIRKRKGNRAKYQKTPFYWELDRTTPRHGDFPFNIGHLDHTELDIELICSKTGKKLGRPYLTLLIDAFSRKVLAFYLSFEQPGYRSCMMVFRDCVRRYNRLPQQIVVDNGREFHSVYFETLLAVYEREVKRRPPAKPRYGSILERIFGTTNTMFIHNLYGNTKIMKNVREVTKSVNPKKLAVWTLPELSTALEGFFFELYENIEHPVLGQTPKEAFESGLFYSGERKEFYIHYDKLFEILTLPSTKNGEATIQQRGIKINYIYYWNDEFKSIHNSKMKVKVRFDPFNIGIAYAYVNKRWIKCISEYYSVLVNLTQKELKYITSEIRRSKQNHSKNYVITAQKIASFINSLENNETYSLIKARGDDTKKVIHLMFRDTKISNENKEISSNEEDNFAKLHQDVAKKMDYQFELYGEF